MKIKSLVTVIAVSAALVACKGKNEVSEAVKLDTTQEKFSYGMGLQIGKMAKTQGVELSLSSYNAGLLDGMNEAEQRLSDEDLQAAFADYQKEVLSKKGKENEEASTKNASKGTEFLAANAKKEGVKTTDSGLQYKVISEGKGAKPTPEDQVKVHYKGTLIDGTEFDSSYARKKPVTFALNGVIKGWQEGLQLMTKGSKYELYIPAELAYGQGGAGKIGPNSTLIFEVELLDINPVEEKPAAEKSKK